MRTHGGHDHSGRLSLRIASVLAFPGCVGRLDEVS